MAAVSPAPARTTVKRAKPPKVFTLQQLCSRFGDDFTSANNSPTSPHFPRAHSSKSSREHASSATDFDRSRAPSATDLDRWLMNAFEAQRRAVQEALTTHQNLMMQKLLGMSEQEIARASSSMPNTVVSVPMPRSVTPKLDQSKRKLHPVEPQAPPLPPMPPLPNQLSEDGAAAEADLGSGARLKPISPVSLHADSEDDLPIEPELSCQSQAPATPVGHRNSVSGGAASRTENKLAFRRAEDLLDQLKMPFWHPGRLVRTTQFDAFICAVIMLNTLVMAFESQYLGLQRGYDLGFPRFTLPASEEWPMADLAFYMMDYVFGVIYFIEIWIKIFGLKMRFCQDPWNYFDTSLVLFWIAEKVLSAYDAVLDQGLLRVLRMGRVLRLLRLVKTIQGFDALYIMTTAMQGSVTVLFWSFVLLMVVQTLIAFTLNQALDAYFKDKSKPVHQQHQVFEYFGTTGRAMFTMFELTLANWPTAARILQENVTEYYGVFSVAYKLVIGFAAVGIINAVFMQETFKVAASDDKLMMRQKERDRMLHTKKMRTLFAAADESGDGFLDQEEFREIMTSPDIRTWLAAQELPIRDPDVLWKLLDDGDAELTADELVVGVERLKGTAKGIDLAAFIMEQREFQEKVCEKLGILEESKEEGENDG
ncbi:unnamed protein product [Effrenium voratum]|nr:unnamed protein product [Effrenium voratum]|mmetsp:Transcript_9499/g.22479  ORF Transcript_9499/g.22479 Transcript_9499/m.22479 type:complete len:650 (-) Transcript_9499:66-2015(-)|eukprot:CAMPEP_0181427460 /NCGR_PEP_ID=MMETSP1110-20121109/16184_1 /TAXON_ID=174948 /ORGANISM="Symbiodinium sp., Strain CCMP421" /LENGTH=649 /DNA_ID=CAMNT_0023550675 /DNA_START=73 /DNA_END=2022 /DNA_ORIENTATION=+